MKRKKEQPVTALDEALANLRFEAEVTSVNAGMNGTNKRVYIQSVGLAHPFYANLLVGNDAVSSFLPGTKLVFKGEIKK